MAITYPVDLELVNPGGETGDMTGWTSYQTALGQIRTSGTDVPAYAGSYYFAGANAAGAIWGQAVGVPTDNPTGTQAEIEAAIDTGTLYAVAQVHAHGDPGDNDTSQLRVECLAADGTTVLATTTSPAFDPKSWDLRTATVAVPSGSRNFRISLVEDTSPNGAFVSVYYDDFSLALTPTPAPQLSTTRLNAYVVEGDNTALSTTRTNAYVVEGPKQPFEGNGFAHAAGSAQGSGLAVANFRWWRVRFPVNNSGNAAGTGSNNYTDLRYIAMFDADGTNYVPGNAGVQANPSTSGVSSLYTDDGDIWNNAGIQQLADGMWVAFNLRTRASIDQVQIRNHNGDSSYSPFIVIVESSEDGLNWQFEFGEARVTWGGAELKTFNRPAIDWETAAYRDWVVQPICTTGYDNLSVYEMEMYEALGDSDLCTGGTPYSTNNSTYPASNLTDNDTGTLCGSTGLGKRAYLGYSFATPVNVNYIKFWQQPSEGPDWALLCAGLGTPGSFAGPWQIKGEVKGMRNISGPTTPYTCDFRPNPNPSNAADPHRYWRIRPTTHTIGNEWTLFAVGKLAFRHAGVEVSTGGTPIARSQYDGGSGPANAFDTDNSSKWLSTFNMIYQWLGYDFGAPVAVDEIQLSTNDETSYWGRTPAGVAVDWSDDGMMWYEACALDTSSFDSAVQTKSFPVVVNTGGIASGTGTASATSTATGAGAGVAVYSSVGAAAAQGAAAGAGAALGPVRVPGTATATSTATATGGVVGPSLTTGSAAAVSSAVGASSGDARTAGTATGRTTVSGRMVATGTVAAVGTAAGVGGVTSASFAVGIVAAVGDAAGVGAAYARPLPTPIVGEAVGRSNSYAITVSQQHAFGRGSATSAAAAASRIVAASPGAAHGASTATAAGSRDRALAGTARATSTAIGFSARALSAAGSATGTGSAIAVTRPNVAAVGSAAGSSTALGTGSDAYPAVAAAAATSDAVGVGAADIPSVATAAAAGAATATSVAEHPAAGTAPAQSATVGVGASDAAGDGSAAGASDAAAAGTGEAPGAGSSAAVSSAAAEIAGSSDAVGAARALSLATSEGVRVGHFAPAPRVIVVDADDRELLVAPASMLADRVIVVVPRDKVVLVPPEDRAALVA